MNREVATYHGIEPGNDDNNIRCEVRVANSAARADEGRLAMQIPAWQSIWSAELAVARAFIRLGGRGVFGSAGQELSRWPSREEEQVPPAFAGWAGDFSSANRAPHDRIVEASTNLDGTGARQWTFRSGARPEDRPIRSGLPGSDSNRPNGS